MTASIGHRLSKKSASATASFLQSDGKVVNRADPPFANTRSDRRFRRSLLEGDDGDTSLREIARIRGVICAAGSVRIFFSCSPSM
ncbi:MAG: hypothetical protein ABI833_11545 [Acidobacteriota bacterium]